MTLPERWRAWLSSAHELYCELTGKCPLDPDIVSDPKIDHLKSEAKRTRAERLRAQAVNEYELAYLGRRARQHKQRGNVS